MPYILKCIGANSEEKQVGGKTGKEKRRRKKSKIEDNNRRGK